MTTNSLLTSGTDNLFITFPGSNVNQFTTTETNLACYFIPIQSTYELYGLPLRSDSCTFAARTFTIAPPLANLAVGTYIVSISGDFDAINSKIFTIDSNSVASRFYIAVSDGTLINAVVFNTELGLTKADVQKLTLTVGEYDVLQVLFTPSLTITGVANSNEAIAVLELDTRYYTDNMGLDAFYISDGRATGF